MSSGVSVELAPFCCNAPLDLAEHHRHNQSPHSLLISDVILNEVACPLRAGCLLFFNVLLSSFPTHSLHGLTSRNWSLVGAGCQPTKDILSASSTVGSLCELRYFRHIQVMRKQTVPRPRANLSVGCLPTLARTTSEHWRMETAIDRAVNIDSVQMA